MVGGIYLFVGVDLMTPTRAAEHLCLIDLQNTVWNQTIISFAFVNNVPFFAIVYIRLYTVTFLMFLNSFQLLLLYPFL